MWLQDHLPDTKLPFTLTSPKRAMTTSLGLASPLWPTFIAAAGAGAAFWWWTQWARGRAEAEAREADAIAEGAAKPEIVMAHAPEPATTGGEPVDASDVDLVEPAEDVMAHTPPTVSPIALAAGANLNAPLSDAAVAAVDESLGVQGAKIAKPKATRKRKVETVPTVTH